MGSSKFVVIKLEADGPQVRNFATATEAAEFLAGKYLPYYAVFKNLELVHLRLNDAQSIVKQLR